jgi:hypothetical protein
MATISDVHDDNTNVRDDIHCVHMQASPIHLHDACTGKVRCSYVAYDDKDEPTAALSLAFSLDGMQLFAGYNKMFRVFEVNRPGRYYSEIPLSSKGAHQLPGTKPDHLSISIVELLFFR